MHHIKRPEYKRAKNATLFMPDMNAIMEKAIAAGAIETSPVQDYDYGYGQGEIKIRSAIIG